MGPARCFAECVNAGRTSAAGVVDHALRMMAVLDADLHFVAEALPDQARRLADLVDQRPERQRGSLAGVPIMIKDGHTLDTPLVERLVVAGAVPLGTSTRADRRATAQAWGWNGTDHTRNPWRLDRSSGGSSAGSAAAVSAGVVPLATGGDSAGSLRIPASFCGVIGMKGTPGRVPRATRSLTQLTCSGMVAADLDDLVTAIEVASGSHPMDPLALPSWKHAPTMSGIVPRVAFSADLGYAAPDGAVGAVVRNRAEQLHERGTIQLVPAPIRLEDPAEAWLALYALDRGDDIDATALAAATEYRRVLDHDLAELFSQVDVLVTPTTPETAFPCGDYEQNLPAGDLAWIFNVSGHPALTVPVGLVNGLPVGAQIVTPPYRDSVAIDLATKIMTPLGSPPAHASHVSR